MIDFLTIWVNVFHLRDEKLVFDKIGEKSPIFPIQSPKNEKQKPFFVKQKMVAICHFYNRFSISDQYDSIEGSPDGLVPQEHKI